MPPGRPAGTVSFPRLGHCPVPSARCRSRMSAASLSMKVRGIGAPRTTGTRIQVWLLRSRPEADERLAHARTRRPVVIGDVNTVAAGRHSWLITSSWIGLSDSRPRCRDVKRKSWRIRAWSRVRRSESAAVRPSSRQPVSRGNTAAASPGRRSCSGRVKPGRMGSAACGYGGSRLAHW